MIEHISILIYYEENKIQINEQISWAYHYSMHTDGPHQGIKPLN